MKKGMKLGRFCMLFFALVFLPLQGHCGTARYVNADTLNVRNSPNGKVVSTLTRGAAVEIVEFYGEWARISRDDQPPNWVAVSMLCEGNECWRKIIASSPARTRSYSTPSPLSGGYAVQCPCSGYKNCIGPRGGSFCYTSGGKKKYR